MPTKRKPITSDALQSVIARAVREADTECKAFIGVFVECIVPKSPDEVNWALRGVQYGKTDRVKCSAAISVVVEQLQNEYIVADELSPNKPSWAPRRSKAAAPMEVEPEPEK
jgi:polysaccharide pyruvyl transferase WcaK-like protein